jgi:alkanesulfonate monooxygenase SsuD/methylene tetrahydromethanopterin reductase-like flavin-dependent oxidoreductase (luciferase family)
MATELPSKAALAYGVFDQIEWEDRPAGEVFEEHLQLIERAERLGFFCYHLSEHHGAPLSLTTSPTLMIAAAAQRTSRIRLGALVFNLPYYDPYRLANEISMLDQMTMGRLELGVGRGVSATESAYFGVNDLDTSRRVYQEDLRILFAAFARDTLTYKGDYHTYDDIPIWMHPVQQPYPPLWFPSSNEGSIAFTAQHGLHTVLLNTIPTDHIRALVKQYDELWQAGLEGPDRMNAHVAIPKVGLSIKVFVADTDAEAERLARAAYDVYIDHITYLVRRTGTPSIVRHGDYDSQLENQTLLVGTPESVAQRTNRLVDETGINYVLASFAWGNLPNEAAQHSMQLFGEHVMNPVRD